MNKIAYSLTLAAVLLAGCDSGVSKDTKAGAAAPAAETVAADKGVLTVSLSDAMPAAYAALPKTEGGACDYDKAKNEGEAKFVSGWSAIAAKEGVLPDAVVLGVSVNGVERFAVPTKQKREDVAQFFKSPKLSDSGFSAYIKLSEAPAGAVVSVYQVFQGKIYHCASSSKL